jgi:REP element-mobilizing transposase RayT
MVRLARVIAVGVPHHITQRGNARRFILQDQADRKVYLDLLRQSTELHGVAPIGYCLMSNHVHLVAVPRKADVLARALNRLRKNSRPGRKDVPQGLNHDWPPHGQLFGTAYATFFTESRRHLARGAQLNRPFVAARRILNHLRHDSSRALIQNRVFPQPVKETHGRFASSGTHSTTRRGMFGRAGTIPALWMNPTCGKPCATRS